MEWGTERMPAVLLTIHCALFILNHFHKYIITASLYYKLKKRKQNYSYMFVVHSACNPCVEMAPMHKTYHFLLSSLPPSWWPVTFTPLVRADLWQELKAPSFSCGSESHFLCSSPYYHHNLSECTVHKFHLSPGFYCEYLTPFGDPVFCGLYKTKSCVHHSP